MGLFTPSRKRREQQFRKYMEQVQASSYDPLGRQLLPILNDTFDSRPCARCGELSFEVVSLGPNARSFEVKCQQCGKRMWFKALVRDTREVQDIYSRMLGILEDLRKKALAAGASGARFFVTVRVLPDWPKLDKSVREPIPREVRVAVWKRDRGRCTSCGAEHDLQFDHIIPVAKGGNSSYENIQLLCGKCNRRKSASI